MATITSSFLKLNWNDLTKGLVLAALSAPLTIIVDTLNAGSLTFDWKHIGIIAVTGAASYLLNNLLKGAQVKMDVSSETAKLIGSGDLRVQIIDPKKKSA